MVAHYGHPRHAHFSGYHRRTYDEKLTDVARGCTPGCQRAIKGLLGVIIGLFLFFWIYGCILDCLNTRALRARAERERERYLVRERQRALGGGPHSQCNCEPQALPV